MAALSPQLLGVSAYNQASVANFPMVDDATGVDQSGSFTLPQELICDLNFPIAEPANYDPAKFHIYEVAVYSRWIVIKLGYDGSPIASASVATDSHLEYFSYFLNGTGNFENSVGRITIGRLTKILENAGVFRFDVAATRIRPSLIHPGIKGVTRISPVHNGEVGDPLYGDIRIASGANTRIRAVELNNAHQEVDGGTNYNGIRLDAVDGEGLSEKCECNDTRELPPPIRRIRGISPTNDSGNFLVQGSECLSINDVISGIVLEDDCATPCCGSEELDVLQLDQNNLNFDVRTLNQMVIQMEQRVSSLEELKTLIESLGINNL